ncbi:MAG: PilZ domain-containing protein [Deltaproteobacteria bacterium]|nr:MAG: PilZ domain-containing protein [Deltaproteobacteria bacterium]
MDTSSASQEYEDQRAEVKWPVTLLAPHGPIEGETEYISLTRILVVSDTSLPSEGDIGLLIKAPNHQALHLSSKVVSTPVDNSDDSMNYYTVELQLTCISESDKDFLSRIIANNQKNKVIRPAQQEKTTPEVPATATTHPNSEPDASDVQLPVSYKRDGKTVKARATRLSPKGCLVLTKKPHRVGTVFSIKITDTRAKKSIQLDGSVSARKRSASQKRWGMLIQFINLTEGDRKKLRQLLADSAKASEKSIKLKYLDTFKGFVLNKLPKEGRFDR